MLIRSQRFLAYAAGSRLAVHAVAENGQIGDVVYHLERPVHAMAMSRDGAYLAVGTGDTLIVQSGHQIGTNTG